MSICVFDNPRTCRREAWQDKELVADMSMQLIYAYPHGHRSLFFGLTYGGKDFIDGKIWCGTVEALPDDLQEYVKEGV